MFFLLSVFLTLAWSAEEAPPPQTSSTKKASNQDWIEVEAKLSMLEAKIKSKENNIQKLILEKNKMRDKDPRLKEVIAEIIKEDKERHQAAIDLEKQKTILNYRFPERGSKAARKYQKVDLKTVSEMEGQLGIEGRLDRSMKKMRSQYGAEEKKDAPKDTTPKDNSFEDEGAVILQK